MADFGDAFNAMYERLILRDFLAKIIPGGIVIFCLLAPHLADSAYMIPSLNLGIWLMLFGAAWILGIAVQAIGEFAGIIKYYPDALDYYDWRAIAEYLDSSGEYPTASKEEERIKKRVGQYWFDFSREFESHATAREQQQKERLVVIKEACGNTSVAIWIGVIAFLLIIATGYDYELDDFKASWWVGFFLMLFLSFFLLAMHRIHVKRQFLYMIQVLLCKHKPE